MNILENGGVCSPKGFRAAGVCCGIKPENQTKKDLAVLLADVSCTAAAVYTLNKVKGAPIAVTRAHLADGKARAVIVNSGNANTCNADGVKKAEKMCRLTARTFGVREEDVIVASTGVIGQPLPIEPIRAGMPALKAALSVDGGHDAASAIMTTDLAHKERAVEFRLGGKLCRIGAMAKGSGMIHPNMATMLSFITTDAAVSAPMLQKALKGCVDETYNMVSVDGDTSTNDMVSVLASGLAENVPITAEGPDFDTFYAALMEVCRFMAMAIARDGEGATKLLECRVEGAANRTAAKIVAKSVICSSLLKAAMFGADANWGRVLCAVGYAECEVDVEKVDVSFSSFKGSVLVCRGGAGVDFSEEAAKVILLGDHIVIDLALHSGEGAATAYGCDLTYDYVKINGDYRS